MTPREQLSDIVRRYREAAALRDEAHAKLASADRGFDAAKDAAKSLVKGGVIKAITDYMVDGVVVRVWLYGCNDDEKAGINITEPMEVL